MNEALGQLAARIRSELVELEQVLQQAEEGWRRVKLSTDDYYLDGMALNLHGFYSGLERIFELIAAVVDGFKPRGENWPQALLQQMAAEMTGIRSAVISDRLTVSLMNIEVFATLSAMFTLSSLTQRKSRDLSKKHWLYSHKFEPSYSLLPNF